MKSCCDCHFMESRSGNTKGHLLPLGNVCGSHFIMVGLLGYIAGTCLDITGILFERKASV